MREIGAFVAAFAAISLTATPSAAFGLRLGPFHIGLPLPGRAHRHVHHHGSASAGRTAGLRDEANLKAVEAADGESPPLLYPATALPDMYSVIFWPPPIAPWPYSYDAIFHTAFTKSGADQNTPACQQLDRGSYVIERIRNQVKPDDNQAQLLQRLAGAFGVAAEYVAKTCPDDMPTQPVARLQRMEWQIEKLAQTLDIIRPPLQAFEQSLNAKQRAQFAAAAPVPPSLRRSNQAAIAADCAAPPDAPERSVEQISQSVGLTGDQRDAIGSLEQAFTSAASELDSHCPAAGAASPVARLEATEARLDSTWRAVLTIQVAMGGFENSLSATQRERFEATDFAAAQ